MSFKLQPSGNRITEITAEDKLFADMIATEFKIPLEEVMVFIRSIRYYIDYGYLNEKRRRMKELDPDIIIDDPFEIFEKDFTIRGITISTDKGSIVLKTDNIYFKDLKPCLRKIRDNVKLDNLKDKEADKRMERKIILRMIFEFFYESGSLNKFNILYGTGKCMVHFKLYGYKPLMEEADFNEDYAAYSYKYYLVDIVKRRLNKIINEYYFENAVWNEWMETEEYQQWLRSNFDDDGFIDDNNP